MFRKMLYNWRKWLSWLSPPLPPSPQKDSSKFFLIPLTTTDQKIDHYYHWDSEEGEFTLLFSSPWQTRPFHSVVHSIWQLGIKFAQNWKTEESMSSLLLKNISQQKKKQNNNKKT